MRYYLSILIVLLGVVLLGCDSKAKNSGQSAVADYKSFIKTYTMNDTFENALFNLKEALKDKGMVVNTVSHISKMLQRTGKDLGNSKQIFTKAENIEFCSAALSRKTMEANPHNIIYCPYIISIYSLAKSPNKTYVSYRKLPRLKNQASNQALQSVEKLLDELAKATIE